MLWPVKKLLFLIFASASLLGLVYLPSDFLDREQAVAIFSRTFTVGNREILLVILCVICLLRIGYLDFRRLFRDKDWPTARSKILKLIGLVFQSDKRRAELRNIVGDKDLREMRLKKKAELKRFETEIKLDKQRFETEIKSAKAKFEANFEEQEKDHKRIMKNEKDRQQWDFDEAYIELDAYKKMLAAPALLADFDRILPPIGLPSAVISAPQNEDDPDDIKRFEDEKKALEFELNNLDYILLIRMNPDDGPRLLPQGASERVSAAATSSFHNLRVPICETAYWPDDQTRSKWLSLYAQIAEFNKIRDEVKSSLRDTGSTRARLMKAAQFIKD